MENSRRCYVCNIDVHRATYAEQLKLKKIFGEIETR